jgi:hypothetical protein
MKKARRGAGRGRIPVGEIGNFWEIACKIGRRQKILI